MQLFLKGFIIGIAKMIPGVSGAMLAINFEIYEKLLDSITCFFNNWKENLRFILIFGSGLLLSIITCSNIILFLLNNYMFITLMFFVGLIFGGIYNFAKSIRYTYGSISIIIIIVILFLILNNNISNNYVVTGNFIDNIMFFVGGIIEIFASIVPGISGTSLLMMIGIYDDIIELMSSIFDYTYVINNINIYISYGLGMFFSFLINSFLISYLIKRYKNICYVIILGLSISSILILLTITFKSKFSFIGIIFLFIGIFLSSVLDK